MRNEQIQKEVLRYLSDSSYNYAVLIDGGWGCGKTFFIKNILVNAICASEAEKAAPRKPKYISLYGCKTIKDIQENIVWELAEEVTKKASIFHKKFIASQTIATTSKKLLSSAIKHFDPDANAYEIISQLPTLKKCIFIFDDLERCDCPINEVFGYINGLVEHEGIKVILVANEQEIKTEKMPESELQYLVAANPNIVWPKKENRHEDYGFKQGIDIEELEHRRSILFSREEIDNNYSKIREKLIGITLHYQPDIAEIIEQIVSKTELPQLLQDTIRQNTFFFISEMEKNAHYNFRTFQFFLSKALFLFQKLSELQVDEMYSPQLVADIIADCFVACVEHKGNIAPPTDEWERIQYDARKKMVAVQQYVKYGDFQQDLFEKEVLEYISFLKCNLLSDDPFNQLRNEYWLHSQKWVEDKIEACLERLNNHQYGKAVFGKMIVTFCSLQVIGFDESYVHRLKDGIIKSMSQIYDVFEIDAELHFIHEPKLKNLVAKIVLEINEVIHAQTSVYKQKSLQEIAVSENWVDLLTKYTESEYYRDSTDKSIFDKVATPLWVNAIIHSDPMTIIKFRQLLSSIYSGRILDENAKKDMPALDEIRKKIDPEVETDLIKKFDLKIIQDDIQKILPRYGYGQ